MSFGITPVTPGQPPVTPGQMPQFMQIQAAGVDLGGPDVQVLNFSTGTTATRGTGENGNRVTITAAGGEGGGGDAPPTLVLALTGAAPGSFNTVFENWNASTVIASEDASWSSGSVLLADPDGIYKVTMQVRIAAESWPTSGGGWARYGSRIDEAQHITSSLYSRWTEAAWDSSAEPFVAFSDVYIVPGAEGSFIPRAYVNNYIGGDPATFLAMLTVTKVGVAVPDGY